MISDGQWDSVFGLGFGRLQGSFSADVVDTLSNTRNGLNGTLETRMLKNFYCGQGHKYILA